MNFQSIKGRYVSDIKASSKRVTGVVNSNAGCLTRRDKYLSRGLCSFEGERWSFSLGMHNFRTLLRCGDSKSRKEEVAVCRDSCVGRSVKKTKHVKNSYRSRRRRLNRFGKYSRHGRFSSQATGISVKKSKKVDLGALMFKTLCRVVRIQWTGRDWRRRVSLSSRLSSETTAVSIKKVKLRSSRCLRRDNFMLTKVFLKLPLAYIQNCGPKGFSNFRRLVGIIGCKAAFAMSNGWRSEDGKRVKLLYDLQMKVRRDEEYAAFVATRDSGILVRASRPVRSDFKNFRDWSNALERWQLRTKVCGPCYKSVYKTDFDEKTGIWKLDKKYDFCVVGGVCEKCLMICDSF